MQAFVIHNIYKFDFINKTVTYRALDNNGHDAAILALGQTLKYTAALTIDGENVSWSDLTDMQPGFDD